MRRTLGTAVFSGMLGVTLFGIFLTPVFFYVIQWLGNARRRPRSRRRRSSRPSRRTRRHESIKRRKHLLIHGQARAGCCWKRSRTPRTPNCSKRNSSKLNRRSAACTRSMLSGKWI